MCSRVRSLLIISKTRPFHYFLRGYSSDVPKAPIDIVRKQEQRTVHIDKNTVALLERLSLVKFETEEAVKVLEDSIEFGDKILNINTDGVEPLYSVLEDENLSLRPDEVNEGNCQKDILKNAAVTEDEYFIAPPGNIPLHEVQTESEHKSIQTEKKNVQTQKKSVQKKSHTN